MKVLSASTIGSILLLVAVGAVADTKIVKLHHADGYVIGGKARPPSDEEYVSWIGDGRMREDRGSTSFVVLEREKRLLVLYHVEEKYSEVSLPFDIRDHLPPEFADQLIVGTSFVTSVVPTGETRTIAGKVCDGYRLEAKSKYLELVTSVWATSDVKFDFDATNRMDSEILSLVYRGDYAYAMRRVRGAVIASEGSGFMPTLGVGPILMTITTKSIDDVEPPAGFYGPPPGYVQVDFDYQTLMAHWD